MIEMFEMSGTVKRKRKALEKAVKTLRDMPVFGYQPCDHQIDFRWPKFTDLLDMPHNAPINAVKLRWKNSTANAAYLGGIQVVLSNGTESPVFLAKAGNPVNADNMKEALLTPAIRKVRGTVAGNYVYEATCLGEKGEEISSIKTNGAGTKEYALGAEEEIIGVYGAKDYHGGNIFHSLGFIVWVPPKF